MAKRTDIKKVLIIGSGPIVIGQAAEFDYAGTQACLALKEEGYEVILCNSNPATIMTDTTIADKVYMEPLTLEYVAKILRYERPDAIVPGIGGQTGLNIAMQLEKKGVLKECGVELLGTSSESIERAEDRELFAELLEKLHIHQAPYGTANSFEEFMNFDQIPPSPINIRTKLNNFNINENIHKKEPFNILVSPIKINTPIINITIIILHTLSFSIFSAWSFFKLSFSHIHSFLILCVCIEYS